MYDDYKVWCGSVGVSPYLPGQFARELASVAEAAGLAIEIRGVGKLTKAYCLDRRLAA